MKYRMFLVDNELWTIVYLKKMLDWSKSNFEIAGKSANSIEAAEKILSLRPDVVFTDIRMPELLGLELMERSREMGFSGEFVILSGFAEFSYAQQVVRLGAFAYCLKPLSPEEGNDLLQRLEDRLDTARTAQASPPAANSAAAANENETFARVLRYIQEHFHEKLHLKDVASHFYLSPGYCSVLFSKNINMTFPEYVTDLRIRKACTLLKTTSLSIDEIALQVGISISTRFSSV